MDALLLYLGDAVVIVGTVVTTAAVIGLFRFDDVIVQMHAAAKGVGFGAGVTTLVGVTSADAQLATKALLTLIALFVTAPLGSHVIARLEYRRRRRRPSEAPEH